MTKDPSPQYIAGMCIFAFGVGAASKRADITVDPLVIQAMYENYYDLISRGAKAWKKYEKDILKGARELGSLCAEKAGKSSKSISLKMYIQARSVIHCPCEIALRELYIEIE
jgi:hypothetical protein